MNLNFHQILFGIVYIIIIYVSFYERVQWVSSSDAKRLLIIGILLLLTAIVTNSLVEHRWDLKFIFDFLILEEVGRWIFLMMAGFAYVLILPSIIIILKVLVKNLKN